jgi:hypothetical protein
VPDLGARRNGRFKAVGTAPSINKTPAGASVVPVAYPVQHDLSNGVGTASTVRFNGDPAYKLGATTQTKTQGDSPGTAGGVRSGTVNGPVKPTGASRTVRVERKPLVRHGDPCTLNGGNCPGVYVAGGGPAGRVKAARPTEDPNPPPNLTPPEKKAWYRRLGGWLSEQASDAGQALEHPIEGAKGVVKGVANIPGDLFNLLSVGATAQAGGDLMNAAAMQQAFGVGNQADTQAAFDLGRKMATNPGAYAATVPTALPMSNAAQRGGDLIASVIPSPKSLAGGVGKLGTRAGGRAAREAADGAEHAAARAARTDAERAARGEPPRKAPEGPGDGAKVKPNRLKEHKPPCFHPYDKAKFDRMSPAQQKKYLQDYSRQLQRQQDGINSMSATEFKAARDAYASFGRNPLADGAQASMRTEFRAELADSIRSSLRRGGMPSAQAGAEASRRSGELMKKLSALHDPDMVAGGWHHPKPTGMGRSDVNSSIGAGWGQNGRIGGMDAAADEAVRGGNGDAKMNTKLEVCRGKGRR